MALLPPDPPEVSVVMPCLNEAETLAECIQKAERCLRQAGISMEIIVADNGSTDDSQRIAERLHARVVHAHVKGYGSALLTGFSAARGDYIIMGDADDTYDFSNLIPFIEQLRAGSDLVVGNRFRGVIEPRSMPRLNRYVGVPLLSLLGRIVCGNPPCTDFHCGLRAIRRSAATRMNLECTGMEFASEMIVRATDLDLRIAEVPTNHSRSRRSRPPHLRRWRDGMRHVRFLVGHALDRRRSTGNFRSRPGESELLLLNSNPDYPMQRRAQAIECKSASELEPTGAA